MNILKSAKKQQQQQQKKIMKLYTKKTSTAATTEFVWEIIREYPMKTLIFVRLKYL